MKFTLNELKTLVDTIIAEVKKSDKKKEKVAKKTQPDAYGYAESFDFSQPLGGYNLYKSQGASNFGPYTGGGSKIDDNVRFPKENAVGSTPYYAETSAWNNLKEMVEPTSAWGLLEKHIGLSRLKGQKRK